MAADRIVLVTGISGFLGSHVADQFLEAGYKVRGTARELPKVDAIKKVFDSKYGEGRVEVVVVPDITVDGAFDEAVKGVHAVAHVASIMSFDKDPAKVIPPTVKATTSILNSCLSNPSIKSFVYTSSSAAVSMPKPNISCTYDSNTWNDEDVKAAWKPGPWDENHQWTVYAASKTEAEKAMWKFRDEKKPHFNINSVLPATNFGPVITPDTVSSTAKLVPIIYGGNVKAVLGVLPQYYIDVRDTGRLHVAAVKFPEIKNERLFGWVEPYNWNKVLTILREIRPQHQFPEDVPGLGEDMSKVSTVKEEELLRRLGRQGWIKLPQTLEDGLKSMSM
ncbi:Nadph-dependent carbonyl reductase from Sporobolomyces Salmonicolor [Stipitochalara longipes BDJ]|nr:Nadph-dependent carbonyl reductase from Sporobolomyces Salmonicolor [Stipitochalara longipes BDJ]